MAVKNKRKKSNGSSSQGDDWDGLVSALSKFAAVGGYNLPTMRANGSQSQGAWLPAGSTRALTQAPGGALWGGFGAIGCNMNAAAVATVLVENIRQSAGSTGIPNVESIIIGGIDGQIDFMGIAANAIPSAFVFPVITSVSVGMYVADFDNATNLYQLQDPSNPADVSRFNWIYLESRVVTSAPTPQGGGPLTQAFLPTYNGQTNPKMFEFLDLSVNVSLKPGQALMLVLAADTPAASVNAPPPASYTGASAPGAVAVFQPSLRLFMQQIGA